MISFLCWMYRVLVIQLLIQSMCISPSASEKNTVSPGTTQFGADFCLGGLRNYAFCCPKHCERCGGPHCDQRDCCISWIRKSGRICQNATDVACRIRSNSDVPKCWPFCELEFNRRRVIAVGFHGEYFRRSFNPHTRGQVCSDFFGNVANINENILSSLTDRGYEVRFFFHTIRYSECPEKDQALLDILRPTAYEFSESTLPRIIDSYMRVISLISRARFPAIQNKSDQSSPIDYALLLRFDVVYYKPFSALNIDMTKVSLAFRDTPDQWNRYFKVSDLFFAMPIRYVSTFRDVLDLSCLSNTARGTCFDGRNGKICADRHTDKRCPAHFIYPRLVSVIGERNIEFIDSKYLSSTINVYDSLGEPYPRKDVFLAINRSCTGFKC